MWITAQCIMNKLTAKSNSLLIKSAASAKEAALFAFVALLYFLYLLC